MLCGRVVVCAVCGAEAARASEAATIEIHPSILPRVDQREESGLIFPPQLEREKLLGGKFRMFVTAAPALFISF